MIKKKIVKKRENINAILWQHSNFKLLTCVNIDLIFYHHEIKKEHTEYMFQNTSQNEFYSLLATKVLQISNLINKQPPDTNERL